MPRQDIDNSDEYSRNLKDNVSLLTDAYFQGTYCIEQYNFNLRFTLQHQSNIMC